MLELLGLATHARKNSDDALNPGAVPTVGKVAVEVAERGPRATVEDLGADSANVEVGSRQKAGGNEALHVIDEPAAVVGKERAAAGGERLPGGLEAPRGLRVAEDRAIEIGAEETNRGGLFHETDDDEEGNLREAEKPRLCNGPPILIASRGIAKNDGCEQWRRSPTRMNRLGCACRCFGRPNPADLADDVCRCSPRIIEF